MQAQEVGRHWPGWVGFGGPRGPGGLVREQAEAPPGSVLGWARPARRAGRSAALLSQAAAEDWVSAVRGPGGWQSGLGGGEVPGAPG